MQNNNGSFEKYKDQVQEFTQKVMNEAEELSFKALDGMQELGHKAMNGTEYLGTKAVQGGKALKEGTQNILDKTIQGMENLENKMKSK